ncbi:MotA/TolQ/ExbB proton channel family protein [Kiritimatiella glycovorans]|uniref:Biopolymer transport protein ExbB n=1 Tax=Kiritimatiella glycovorans TaxID=1307763 RepID=A0A0G3EAT1_9BACT|nr:MotA/TolQ/ExbB proton channel family protein [Kiritimatiella glycovorans]AKJ63368.1 Biopolymer transport protein ExbB [Kiritimatiella glycovorans]
MITFLAAAGTSSFFRVVADGGALGIVLWTVLALLSLAACSLVVDSLIRVRRARLLPAGLLALIEEAARERDLQKVRARCEAEPGPLSAILLAGIERSSEGIEAMRESAAAAAEMEREKLLQRVHFLSVVGNLTPMCGLLGTVQGMILAFATLGTEAGAAKNAMLALNISQALYTTAAGLLIAVPALGCFHVFRNRASKILLALESASLDLAGRLGGGCGEGREDETP